MTCQDTVTVNVCAINWLKEKYPELCIKAGLCERIAGRLYTKTYTTPPNVATPPAAQPAVPLTDGQVEVMWKAARLKDNGRLYKLDNQPFVHFARAIEAAHGIKENT